LGPQPRSYHEELIHENEAMKKMGYQPYSTENKGSKYSFNPWVGLAPYFDNLTGSELPTNLVEKARKEEIDFMLDWQVWEDGLAMLAGDRKRPPWRQMGGRE
jgi:hypothetical protein